VRFARGASLLLLSGLGAAFFACSSTPSAPGPCTPGADASYLTDPLSTLSAYCMVSVQNANIVPLSADVVPYAPSNTLFSDYAVKVRTVWVPKGQHATWDDTKVFDLPVGSIITKSFGFPADFRKPEPVKWIETRLLIRTATACGLLPPARSKQGLPTAYTRCNGQGKDGLHLQ
jgi:hypothetical protein